MFNDCLYISYTTATGLHPIFSVKIYQNPKFSVIKLIFIVYIT